MEEQKDTQENSLAVGRAIIKKYMMELPHSAGVYRMIDTAGNTLYVGKAKSLKNRVANYVNVAALNTRLQRMVSLTASMEFVNSRSEAEALLLEANLIKKYAPRYNVLLKDDKSFPYIFFSDKHDFPRISKHRGTKIEKGKYFGPFVSAGAVDDVITLLQKAFLLRPCADNIFKNRTRPCLQYQIKRCSAPCVDYISKADYAALAHQAQEFLSGKSRQIQEELIKQMQAAAAAMDYEQAGILRDRIRSLTQVQQQSKLTAANVGDADLIALARAGTDVCIQIVSFRGGQNYGSKNYFPSNTNDLADGDILSCFIAQFYAAQPVPKLILVSAELEDRELLEEALNLHADHAIHINYPQRGEKHDLVVYAVQNAREALMRHIAGSISQKAALIGVAELFSLPEIPKRIEVYDNSHIQGSHQVGAMIVAGVDGFIKGQYRKFDIKGLPLPNPPPQAGEGIRTLPLPEGGRAGELSPLHTSNFVTPPNGGVWEEVEVFPKVATQSYQIPQQVRDDNECVEKPSKTVQFENKCRGVSSQAGEGIRTLPLPEGGRAGEGGVAGGDDYAMLREVLTRRFKRLKDEPENTPDLVLIDGGAGQVSIARQVFAELGISHIFYVGIAKGVDRNAGREWFFVEGRAPFQLPENDAVLHYLQRLRDEAHRFAIGAHRDKRSKSMQVSELDMIDGIGAARKKALLHYFGSARAVAAASIDEIGQAAGISAAIAQKIYQHFHGG